jgi:hypothetical protein
MRIVGVAIGIVLACLAAIWTLQGFGLPIGNSPMVGDRKWSVIGVVVILIGLAIAGFSWRRGRKS